MFHGRPKPVRFLPRTVIGPLPSGPFPSHKPFGVIVMDSGADYQGESSLTYLTSLVKRYTNRNGFGDVPVHYFIDKEGKIYMGRSDIAPAEIHQGDSFTLRMDEVEEKEAYLARLKKLNSPLLDLNNYIVIMLLGDYNQQMVTEEQEKQMFQLISNLVHAHNIPLSNILALKDKYPETKNPGFYLNNYLQPTILEKNVPPPPGTHRFMIPPQLAEGRS
ncbi:MAG: peptidoglycan recognition family protein [bacterium]